MSTEKLSPLPSSPLKDIFNRNIMPPFSPDMLNIPDIRQKIIENGFNLELDESQLASLEISKFRNYQSGRGIAMKAVLGDRLSEFKTMIRKECADYPRSIAGDKTRGARQLAADLVAVAVEVITPEEFCDKINRRFRKSIDPKFKNKIAGLPLSAALAVIEFFTE